MRDCFGVPGSITVSVVADSSPLPEAATQLATSSIASVWLPSAIKRVTILRNNGSLGLKL